MAIPVNLIYILIKLALLGTGKPSSHFDLDSLKFPLVGKQTKLNDP